MRRATKAGTWYSASAAELTSQFNTWLEHAEEALLEDRSPVLESSNVPRAIIAPHAGYRYSGPTAAYAYRCLANRNDVKRVFLLGPSHYLPLSGVAVSPASTCETPLGPITVDKDTVREIEAASSVIKFISIEDDAEEHSLELHMPFIHHMMKETEDMQLVHMMVGQLSEAQEKEVARVLLPYFEDHSNVFVISSDFCHWGRRFSYTRATTGMPIHSSIAQLDKRGMALIESQDPDAFRDYLHETHNTICGRKPISLLLQMIALSSRPISTSFLHYAQSSKCFSIEDSSVSYASACVYERSQASSTAS